MAVWCSCVLSFCCDASCGSTGRNVLGVGRSLCNLDIARLPMESPRASPQRKDASTNAQLDDSRAGTLDTAYRNNFGADSVPKPCRCFCCAVLVLLSVCQTLLMDRLDPVTLAAAFRHRPSRPAQRQDSMTNMTTTTVTTTTPTVTTTTTTYKFGVLCRLRIKWAVKICRGKMFWLLTPFKKEMLIPLVQSGVNRS